MIQDEGQKKILEFGRAKLKAYEDVINAIERGSSETEACRKYNVGRTSFRNFLRRDYYNNSKFTKESDEKYFSWKDKLCADVFGEDITVCENFDEAYKYVKSTLTEREVSVLELRYEKGLYLDEVGKNLGVSKERARQLVNKVIYKLKHPKRAKVLLYGVEYLDLFEKQKQNLVKIKIKDIKDFNDILVEDLNLSNRTYNCLKRAGADNLQDIIDYSNEYGLSRIRNFGWKSYYELNENVAQFGIALTYLKE